MVKRESFPGGPVHMIGIGGYGMRGLARLFYASGRRVSGCDANDSAVLGLLRKEGIRCTAGNGQTEVPDDAAFVVHSAAVSASHAALASARRRGLPCFKYSDALGGFCADKTVLACAGTHGKSTTTALLAFLLKNAGLHAGHVVGADPAAGMPDFTRNAVPGDPMVIEACEYDCSFHRFHPAGVLITNIELEHVDCFPTRNRLLDAFCRFIRGMQEGGVVVSSPQVLGELAAKNPGCFQEKKLRAVAAGGEHGWRLEERYITRFGQQLLIRSPDERVIEVACPLPGLHNAQNMLSVLALACELYRWDVIAPALAELPRFKGIDRRFEIKCSGSCTVVDDYAHHPDEVRATLTAAREAFPDMKRLVAVFQPHQRLRLKTFSRGFLDALMHADDVVVTPVFAAREPQDKCVTEAREFSRGLTLRGCGGLFSPSLRDAKKTILSFVREGDVVVFLGAGDITLLAAECADGIAERERMYDKENQAARGS